MALTKVESSLLVSAVVSKTAAYTATLNDGIILCSSSSGAFTVTLPTAVGNTGKVFKVSKPPAEPVA